MLLLLAYTAGTSLAETGRVVPRLVADRGVEYPPGLLYPLGTIVTAVAVTAAGVGRIPAGPARHV
ncbi:hypothetical protein RB614_12180 [Phytohabitans sp. ZYX-F-186]|uniref:Uncharacterized protein n=1 Tax=Phytohabitans maris TaxID=3071409 RepID=A0ABU0ZDZ5_9ACTN|nr:hypothetical protein [Phytohabitans sp. ZYX-F-186]MDQ7905283.1 hypothetical protein [Phytohabitans sp. ZYX-F-186]